jgi:GNAT superfamily N-acetyltransferase
MMEATPVQQRKPLTPSEMVEIKPVQSRKELGKFIDFPHDLYKDDPCYVPELFIAQRDLLTPGKHPFHNHSSLQLFLAWRNGKIVGRIAAIENNSHNEFNQAQDGFFGFFDSINDQAVADALFSTAEAWLKQKGATTMIGPVNFSTNETCALLVEGFDTPPMAMMTYNKPYYLDLIMQAGFAKKVDTFAHKIVSETVNEKPRKMLELLRKRLEQRNITIRKINMKKFREDADKIREVYNAAWDKNLGFVPMTREEFDYSAKDLKMIVDPDFVLLAEHEGKVIGITICIPDINQILINVKRGRLFPTGIFKLLFGRKKINALRIMVLGVLEEYRKLGIEAVFYGTIMENGLKKGMKWGEASWVLETNEMMNKGIENSVNGKVYKKYRIFEKAI